MVGGWDIPRFAARALPGIATLVELVIGGVIVERFGFLRLRILRHSNHNLSVVIHDRYFRGCTSTRAPLATARIRTRTHGRARVRVEKRALWHRRHLSNVHFGEPSPDASPPLTPYPYGQKEPNTSGPIPKIYGIYTAKAPFLMLRNGALRVPARGQAS